jgi:hypothetical protein
MWTFPATPFGAATGTIRNASLRCSATASSTVAKLSEYVLGPGADDDHRARVARGRILRLREIQEVGDSRARSLPSEVPTS